MKKLLSLVLAAIMVLSVMSFALAEDTTVTIVAWDVNTTPLPDRAEGSL